MKITQVIKYHGVRRLGAEQRVKEKKEPERTLSENEVTIAIGGRTVDEIKTNTKTLIQTLNAIKL